MRVLFLTILLLTNFVNNAQKIDCSKQIKEYQEFLNVKNFHDALSPWEFVAKNCPKQSPETYTDGIQIHQYKIDNTSTQEDKEKQVRELMKLYDQFYKNFPEEAKDFEVKKAMLLVDKNIDAKNEIFTLFESGFAEASDKVKDANTIYNYFKIYNQKFVDGDKKITTDMYIEKYQELNQLLSDLMISNPSNSDEYTAALKALKSTGKEVINCDNLASYYNKNLTTNAENIKWFEGALELLKVKCNNTPIFLTMAERYYNLNRTAKSAGYVALASIKNRKFDDAKKYYDEAATLETNPVEKAKIYYDMGVALYNDNLGKTKEYLSKAIELDPKLTRAYIYLSQAYANNAEKCSKNDFEKKVIYYLAIQTARKALINDPKSAPTIESLTTSYAKKALTLEEIHSGKLSGKSHTVGCDINETVTFPLKK